MMRNDSGSAKDHRPWGYFEIISDLGNAKIKKLTVYPGQRLSLQKHRQRSEHWFILDGTGGVTLGGHEMILSAGQSADIPVETLHRIRNNGTKNLVVIEIQTGTYFGEDDIERMEDDYGRID